MLNWSGIINLSWTNGRRLTGMRKGISSITYTYDESGLRTKKQVNSTGTVYDRDASGNLVHETRNNGTNHLYYYYDANGNIGSISYNGIRYAFRKNLQGDVIAILDTNSNVVARYTYDAWGNILSITDASGNAVTSSTHIANINPIRYRGYYYDTETGWYYLNSRYYDPSVRRFINADDSLGDIGSPEASYNLYVYCLNNPVTYTDPSGHMVELLVPLSLISIVEIAAVCILTIVMIGVLVNALPQVKSVPHLTEIIPFPHVAPEPDPEPDNEPGSVPVPVPNTSSEPNMRKDGIYYSAYLLYPGIDVVLGYAMDIDEAKSNVLAGQDVWTPQEIHVLSLAVYASGGYENGSYEQDVIKGNNAYHYHLKNRRNNGVHIFWGYQGVSLIDCS